MYKIILLLAALYLLVLLQVGLFPHFVSFALYRYFVIIFIILITFFERTGGKLSFTAALVGGFLTDVFSSGFMGVYIFLFFALVFAIKLILRRYVRFPLAKTI